MSYPTHQKHINIATVILAGGKGIRLFPLTLQHSKPAVSFGGRYRLIDIPISNSLNSNIRQIFIIGQYLTAELHHHLCQTYHFDSFFPGSLDFLTPEELPTGEKVWFDGTADAIRKNIDKIFKVPVDYFLILSGDQLYNINFQHMFAFAKQTDADLIIAALPVREKDAKRMGLLSTDKNSFVRSFSEKPQSEETLKSFRLEAPFFKKWNLPEKKSPYYLGSMGIYIFKRKALKDLLLKNKGDDFGQDLIPKELKRGKTACFVYKGYWEDIGTIKSFYDANISLTVHPSSGIKTYDEKNPIYTNTNNLPGAKLRNTAVENSLICEGCIIEAKKIINSIIGRRSYIRKNTVIEDSVILGNDYYEPPKHRRELPRRFEIGENCWLKRVIVDEHVHIGNNVKLINKNKFTHYDSNGIYVRDGIIIVTYNSYIPDNFVF